MRMRLFLTLLRRIFNRKLTVEERRQLVKILKEKKQKEKNLLDGL